MGPARSAAYAKKYAKLPNRPLAAHKARTSGLVGSLLPVARKIATSITAEIGTTVPVVRVDPSRRLATVPPTSETPKAAAALRPNNAPSMPATVEVYGRLYRWCGSRRDTISSSCARTDPLLIAD
jgi:hypothetical protein